MTLHEVLAQAFPYLTTTEHPLEYVDGKMRTYYICKALAMACQAEAITYDEREAAMTCVVDAVRQLDPAHHAVYLHLAATNAGLLNWHIKMSSEEYIHFRDEWLRELIATKLANYRLADLAWAESIKDNHANPSAGYFIKR